MTEHSGPGAQDEASAAATPELAEGQDSANPGAESDDTPDNTPDIDALAAQVQEYRDAALRARAELENALKRQRRELENAHKYGTEKLAGLLLPVVDSLERAVSVDHSVATETLVAQLVEGNRLTLNLLNKALADADISVIDPQGEPFDPGQHQAITMQPTDAVPANHVVDVMQKGYRLHDRLVRPAMVVVAQAPKAAEAESAAEDGAD